MPAVLGQKLGQAIMCLGEAALAGNQGPVGCLSPRRDRRPPCAWRPETRERIASRSKRGVAAGRNERFGSNPVSLPGGEIKTGRRRARFSRHSRPWPPPADGGNQPGGAVYSVVV